MTTGCSVRYGGGEPPDTLSRLVRDRGGVPSLRANRPMFRTQSLPHPSSAQPTVDSRRRLARGVTRSGDLRCPTSRQTCTARETASMVRTWLAACSPSEEGGLPQAARLERGAREARANASARAHLGRALPSKRARIGRSRSCSRVVDVVAEVDRQWPAQRSGRSPFHPIWKRSGTGA